MQKILYKSVLCVAFLILFGKPVTAFAASPASNQVLIMDEANLFSQEEERKLEEAMSTSLEYGNMLLVTSTQNPYGDSYTYADQLYLDSFGSNPGIIFLIDLDERMLWLSAMDGLDYTLTDYDCEIITDNVYTYARSEKYYECAAHVFSQVHSALVGKYVPKPMKYICSLLICLLFSLIINALIAMNMSKKKKPTNRSWQANMISHCDIKNPTATFLKETKVYRPREQSHSSSGHSVSHSSGHSSGGSHHSSGGSHHSSGGSHHSSGGGHRF